jgi:hypothetical protein
MTSRPRDAADAILVGYRRALETGGRAYTLAERHGVLRQMAVARLHQPERFWERLSAFPEVVNVPDAAMKTIQHAMPEQGLELRLLRRRAGLGSLGRERYVAVAHWRGGLVAREAKALAPSAAVWAGNHKAGNSLLYQEVLDRAVRCPDPFVRVHKKWIVRRLAPDCSRIELSALPKQRDEVRLLRAMGWETANIHLGTGKAKELLADLDRREKTWLVTAARKMEEAVVADFTEQ